MCAARRPSPTALVMSVAPFTTSPAAKTYGTPVWSVAGSGRIVPSAFVGTWSVNAPVSGVMPIALTITSQGIT